GALRVVPGRPADRLSAGAAKTAAPRGPTMSDQYTPAVARALAAATAAAVQAGATAEPWFLFLKLIEEEEGRAAGLLAQAGVSPAEARDRLGRLPPRHATAGTIAAA